MAGRVPIYRRVVDALPMQPRKADRGILQVLSQDAVSSRAGPRGCRADGDERNDLIMILAIAAFVITSALQFLRISLSCCAGGSTVLLVPRPCESSRRGQPPIGWLRREALCAEGSC